MIKDNFLEVFDSDQIHEIHNTPKKIGKDFTFVQDDKGIWMIRLVYGSSAAHMGASEYEIALWKSREAMYAVFAKLYAADSIEVVKDIIKHSRRTQHRR